MQRIAEELKVTYSDILSLGESNQRIELFDGECVMSAMPNTRHQLIATELASFLRNYVKEHGLGKVFGAPVDIVLSPTMVFQPDVSFLSNERTSVDDGKKLNGAPNLVVEILSESTEERDKTFKFREYARAGATEYWIVDPSKKIVETYQNSPKGFQLLKIFGRTETLNTPLFPAVDIPLHEVFE